MLEYVLPSLSELLQPANLLVLVGGTAMGLVFGALPGLSATIGVAVLLPLTFALPSNTGLALLVAVYIGGISGGLISATLWRIPGTASSVATTFDGFPLAQKGQAAKALGTGIFGSFIGGMLGLAVMILVAPIIAQFALRFGPYEYFGLTLFALSLVSVLSRGAMLKGILAALLGLFVASVGAAPLGGTPRFTLGLVELYGGFGIVPVLVGLFATSQMIRDARLSSLARKAKVKIRGVGITLRELRENIVNILRSALIGLGIGILPGIGGAASNLVAYAAAKQASRKPEEFGTGTVEGVWAAETANNASVGGALIPLMTLGIPGDGVTAVLLGGFLIHGLQPGPLLFRNNPDTVVNIYMAYFISMCLMLVLMLGAMRLFPRLLQLPRNYLLPIIFVMTVVGSFTFNNRLFDVWVMLGFGVLGYFLERYKFPLSPLVLGFILGPIVEQNLRRSLMFSDGQFAPFLQHPIAVGFFALTLLSLAFGAYTEIRRRRTAEHPITRKD